VCALLELVMAVLLVSATAPGERAPVGSGLTGGVAGRHTASASGTRPQTTEEVDPTANSSKYQEDLHWKPLSAPEE
jgi:hypothetical protein